MITFFAPASRCFCAPSRRVKNPVDSSTTSTPRSPHGSAAGSRSESIFICSPPALMTPSPSETSPGNGPSTESYLRRCAIVAASPRSLTRDDLDVGAERLLRAEEVPPDAPEAVDAHANRHRLLALVEWSLAFESSPVAARCATAWTAPRSQLDGVEESRRRPSYSSSVGSRSRAVDPDPVRRLVSERASWGRRSSSELLPQPALRDQTVDGVWFHRPRDAGPPASRMRPRRRSSTRSGDVARSPGSVTRRRARRPSRAAAACRPSSPAGSRARRAPAATAPDGGAGAAPPRAARSGSVSQRAGGREAPRGVELPLGGAGGAHEVRVVGVREPVRLGAHLGDDAPLLERRAPRRRRRRRAR